MTYRDLFHSLETLAMHDAALALTLGADAYSDAQGEMAKHCATQAFSTAQGDPRGYVLSLYPKTSTSEDRQSGRATRICVPGRER